MFAAISPFHTKVPEGHVMLIERNGKYNRTVGPGAHYMSPFTEKAHDFISAGWGNHMHKKGKFLEMTQQHWESGDIKCQTVGEIPVWISARADFRVVDAYKASYQADVLPNSILAATQEVFRNTIAKIRLEDLSEVREELSQAVCDAIGKRTDQWGIQLDHVAIGQYGYPQDVEKTIIQRKKAEKEQDLLRIQAQTSLEQAELQRKVDLEQSKAQAEQDAVDERAKAERQEIAAEARAKTEQIQARSEAEISKIDTEAAARNALIEAQGAADAEREKAKGKADAYRLITDAECARLQEHARIVGGDAAAQILAETKRAEALQEAFSSPQNRVIVTTQDTQLKLTDPSSLFHAK